MTLFAVAVLAVQSETYSLRWQPAKGAVVRYRFAAKTIESEDKFEMEAVMEHTVTAVNRDGYTVKSVTKDALLRTGLGEIRDARQDPAVVRFLSTGAVGKVEQAKDTAATFRFLAFVRFIAPPAPVAVGGTWSHSYPAAKKFGGAKLGFTLDSVKEGRAVVHFSVDEAGSELVGKGTGTFTINLKDNSLAEFHATIENWLVPGAKTEVLMAPEPS